MRRLPRRDGARLRDNRPGKVRNVSVERDIDAASRRMYGVGSRGSDGSVMTACKAGGSNAAMLPALFQPLPPRGADSHSLL